ncbi:SubName: Full=Related to FMP40-Found in Mitochondrial Proteome {ECO:0000313/EMBL:CCA78086.1} [Serendipita indica DSM 11827]|nr:SubName: Full=Related to FMP40-Found in Mitochondrial Proteome {ECO:0000313/EMBL:CCA78086.1} [Serendipita indica DSM 11827]
MHSNKLSLPLAKSPAGFLKLIQESPSLIRRARLLDSSAHFSYVTPLPVPFPFRIEFPDEIEDKRGFIEAWLSHREATEPIEQQDADKPSNGLTKYTSADRLQERELIGVSEACVQDCFPQLDIGDALDLIGKPSLMAQSLSEPSNHAGDSQSTARQELVDILSGHTVLASYPANEADSGYAPWSLRYSGHQFGQWAGQLGDGRAISILEVTNPSSPSGLYELQLKVVRSSIREYLCAEAMHALGVPTTRSLALTLLPTLPVMRERIEKAAIVTRVAPSFLRVGSFQALNPPEQMFFFGGGQQAADLEALRILGEYVSKHVLRLDLPEGAPWGKALLMECAKRNSIMVAGWQAYGFMHGVINTDNVSIMGLTIDYGPYAFMDVYDSGHICNHSDDSGRYSFKLQPTMILYALRALLSSLAPVIGSEMSTNAAVQVGWTKDVPPETTAEWTKSGLSIQEDMESFVMNTFMDEYVRLMRRRLGLLTEKETDFRELITPMLALFEQREVDYSSTMRRLAWFDPEMMDSDRTTDLQAFLSTLETTSQCAKPGGDNTNSNPWADWFGKYALRINEEKAQWTESAGKSVSWLEKRKESMLESNPRFILRQWLLEDVIAKVEKDHESGRRVLAKVLEMALNPFKAWGAEELDEKDILDAETREERRFCSLGEQGMLGFQCFALMVRIKNRWLLVEFLNPNLDERPVPFTTSKIFHALKNSAILNFGDAGWGAIGTSLSVKYYSPTTSLCIIRVGREHVRIAKAAVTLLTELEGTAIIPIVLHTSGTIKKLQLAAIEHNRLVVARFRARGYKANKGFTGDTLDSYLESSTHEIQAIDD